MNEAILLPVSNDGAPSGGHVGGASDAEVLANDNDDGAYIQLGADGSVAVFVAPLPAAQSIASVTVYAKYKFLGVPAAQTLTLSVRQAGVSYDSTPQPSISATYAALDDEYAANPATTRAWTVPAINAPMAIGFEYGASAGESIRISYLVAKVLYMPQPQEVDAVRDIGTRRIWIRRRGDRRIELVGGIKFLNYRHGSRIDLHHIAGPHSLGRGWGDGIDERRPLWVESGPHWDPATQTVRLICIDHRPKLCLMYDSGSAAFANLNRDGLARMSPGALWTMDRASRAECLDGTGQLVSVGDDVESFADRGQVIQGSRRNYLKNSAFGLLSIDTNWTSSGEDSNGSAITPSTTEGLWSADLSPRSVRLLSGTPIHAADLQHAADVISHGSLRGNLTMSVYHQDAGGVLSLAAQRAIDSKWYRASDQTWQATKTWNPLTSRTTWARDQISMDVGGSATDISFFFGVPTATGVAGQVNLVAHAQIENGTYAAAPIYTTDALYERAADDLRTENNAGKRTLAAGQFTAMVECEPFWNPSDLTGLAPEQEIWTAYHDANNSLVVKWFDNSNAFFATLTANGVVYTASVSSSPARGTRKTITVRFTGQHGEHGLAPYTLDIFDGATKGTSVIAAQPMIEAATAYIQFAGWDGYIRQRFFSPQVLTDAEIARGI